MKFFLDTANVAEIREAAQLGFLDGVTTNPSLVAKTGRKFREVVEEICAAVEGPVSLEVVATELEPMLAEGRELAKIAKNVVVKCPLTRDGLKATKALAAEGTRVNVTLCFTPLQALFAARAGAAYISPFVGRLDDRGQDGMDMVRQIRTIYDNYGFETEILVASVRHPVHVLEAALMGADVATLPFDVFGKLIQHPLTDLGLQQFLKDWQKVPR
ncbi:MAG TPA: fructose-6-phosphate aldolase [Planctomycetota bacterium]|nr:fructose-6-phosphate aldolase [Planctomycetota bacterium]